MNAPVKYMMASEAYVVVMSDTTYRNYTRGYTVCVANHRLRFNVVRVSSTGPSRPPHDPLMTPS